MHHRFNTASPDRYLILKEYADRMKNFPTEAEACIWNYLRRRQMGVKFNRQHIIGDFIVDFVCLECKLVVEIDGGYHYQDEQIISDAERTDCLKRMGFRVIRFDNNHVLVEIDDVLDTIACEIEHSLSQH